MSTEVDPQPNDRLSAFAEPQAVEATSGLTHAYWRLWVCALLAVPLVLLAHSQVFDFLWIELAWANADLLQFALATPIALWGGSELFAGFARSLRCLRADTWTLLGLGVGTAYVYSSFAALAPELFPMAFRTAMDGRESGLPLYFDSVAVIVCLMLVGRVLELRARRNTAGAIRRLLSLAPETAIRIRSPGVEESALVSDLRVGDLIRIRPGDRIAVDGIVVEGSSPVDESMLTGEFQQVRKLDGDGVVGGTMNISGSLTIRATRVGKDRVLARIVQLVEQAQESRAPIQDYADGLVGQFVPLVILIVLCAFGYWAVVPEESGLAYAMQHAMSVLIVATPCALGLAAPLSMLVGTGEAAKQGVLIKHATALQTLAIADAFILDKTGTLTTGHPEVISVDAFDDRYEAAEVLAMAAGLEAGSEHPLGSAIRRAAHELGVAPFEVTAFASKPGLGVTGRYLEREIGLGSSEFLEDHGFDLSAVTAHAADYEEQGQTAVWVFDDGACIGLLAIADTIKPSARIAVDALRRQGCEIIMMTGDSEATAVAVASKLQITDVYARVKPEHKAIEVDRWRLEGWVVAMAGDGVNDAPALAAANVGIAMSTGSDVAIESADITLVGGDLHAIVRARDLSRRTLRNIKQNISFAFFFHALAIPVAAGFFYVGLGLRLTPGLLATAMALGTLAVIGNSLRLRWWNAVVAG